MIKKNVFSASKQKTYAHNGIGQIDFLRPFSDQDFESNLSFIDFVEIPPGDSIGYHQHADNEEIYFIVEGLGTMTTNGEPYQVNSGDLIVNKCGWQHGLYNSGNDRLRVLVWEIALTPNHRAKRRS